MPSFLAGEVGCHPLRQTLEEGYTVRSLLTNFELAKNTWGMSSSASSTWAAPALWSGKHELSTTSEWTCATASL